MGIVSAESKARFEANFIGVYGALIGHTRSKIRHHQDAEDIVARVALKAWRAWPRFIDQNFSAWIHRILANEIIDFHRDNCRQIVVVSSDLADGNEQAVAAVQTAAHGLRDINREIAKLSPTLRNTVQCVFIDGLSVKETAEKLHLSESAIKTNVFRARRALRLAEAI